MSNALPPDPLPTSPALPALYQATLDAMDAGVVLYGPDNRIRLCNAAFRALYPPVAHLIAPGMHFEALLRAAIAAGLMPEADADVEAFVAQRLAQQAAPGEPILRRLADGHWRRITEQRLPDGSLLAFSIDVTELVRERAERDAARAEAERLRMQLQDAVDALPEGFALYDADDRLVLCNQRYREVYALSAGALQPGTRFEAILRYGLARGQYPAAEGGAEAWLEERLYRHRHPSEPLLQELPGNRWLRIDERRTRQGGIAGVRSEVTELVRREQELRRLNAQLAESRAALAQLSETDALTGIANRRSFDRALREEWLRSRRHRVPLSLLLVDVDHFKRYNDALGHPRGDDCLREIASHLKACARRAGDIVARYGGEEFALLLPHTERDAAAELATLCMRRLEEVALPHPDSPLAPVVTLSIGVAAVGATPSAGEPDAADALLRAADEALYRAKAAGRRRCVVSGVAAGQFSW